MVRTTDLHTRLSLAGLVSDADLPCKRLFLDYHGLKILQNWMSGLGWTPQDLDLKLAMEDVLRSLNVPNRTMLNESKVWETISRWSKANPENEAELLLSRASSPDHNPSKESTSSPPRTPLSVTPATSVEGTPVPAEKAKAAARTILET